MLFLLSALSGLFVYFVRSVDKTCLLFYVCESVTKQSLDIIWTPRNNSNISNESCRSIPSAR